MSLPMLIALVLAGGVLLGLLQAWRRASGAGGRLLRVGLLIGSAIGVWLFLHPPAQPRPAALLRIHTADAPAVEPAPGDTLDIALPEAPASAPGVRVPDLASALRRWPQIQSLQVLGAGLPLRDHAAARGLPLRWTPSPAPTGLRALHAARQLTAGSPWPIHACWAGLPPTRITLRDPAGRVAAQATPDAQGCVDLQHPAPAPGLSLWTLEAAAADGAPVALLDLPLQVLPGQAARVLLLGGAPGPEWKYLRRWALDARLDVRAGFALGAGMRLGDPGVLPQDLDQLDLLVLDERTLATLGAPGRRRLQEAVGAGLGVLLRLTGPLDPAAQTWLRGLGLTYQPAAVDPELPWPLPVSTPTPNAPAPPPLILHRRPLQLTGPWVQPLLRSPAGEPVAGWTPVGQGRLGVLWLTDSFRLHLAGPPGVHGQLWQAVLQPLLRRTAPPPWQIAPWLWADQRARVCGLPPAMQWRSPAGEVWPLAVTPTADGACADVWPTEAGWHTLETPTGDIRQPVYVHPAEAVPSLQVLQLRDATLDLAQHSPREPASATHTQPGPSWPWALLWLLCSAGLAWVERRDRRPSA